MSFILKNNLSKNDKPGSREAGIQSSYNILKNVFFPTKHSQDMQQTENMTNPLGKKKWTACESLQMSDLAEKRLQSSHNIYAQSIKGSHN